jgi:hypothetical protein
VCLFVAAPGDVAVGDPRTLARKAKAAAAQAAREALSERQLERIMGAMKEARHRAEGQRLATAAADGSASLAADDLNGGIFAEPSAHLQGGDTVGNAFYHDEGSPLRDQTSPLRASSGPAAAVTGLGRTALSTGLGFPTGALPPLLSTSWPRGACTASPPYGSVTGSKASQGSCSSPPGSSPPYRSFLQSGGGEASGEASGEPTASPTLFRWSCLDPHVDPDGSADADTTPAPKAASAQAAPSRSGGASGGGGSAGGVAKRMGKHALFAAAAAEARAADKAFAATNAACLTSGGDLAPARNASESATGDKGHRIQPHWTQMAASGDGEFFMG